VRLRITVALAAAAACAGCGADSGGSSPVSLRVTHGFGAHTVTSLSAPAPRGHRTQLALLTRYVAPLRTTRDGGVTSIAGHTATGDEAWSFYVNGIAPKKTAGQTKVYAGDQVWWDLHPTRATDRIPSVVGLFPEPFRDGLEGRRYPSTIECSPGMKAACATITDEFTHLHIPLSPTNPGYGSGTDSLSINVGTWQQIATEVVGALIGKGPGASGVYAHFSDAGHRLVLLDGAGAPARSLGAGAGLIAATAGPSDVPTWVVTGTDPAGVRAAARSLTASALAGHFALAVQGARRYPVPTGGG
jgi:hypothetical protein